VLPANGGFPAQIDVEGAMDAQAQRKRRHARLTFNEPVTDQITATHDVQILDLSMTGARVEHGVILRPGSTCHLRLPLGHNAISVLCHVVWSRAVGRAEPGRGKTGLLFHSGLEFAGMSPDARAVLSAFLDSQGTPPTDNRHET
jgi:hypothetical protein